MSRAAIARHEVWLDVGREFPRAVTRMRAVRSLSRRSRARRSAMCARARAQGERRHCVARSSPRLTLGESVYVHHAAAFWGTRRCAACGDQSFHC